jgi:hypothetical protein
MIAYSPFVFPLPLGEESHTLTTPLASPEAQ